MLHQQPSTCAAIAALKKAGERAQSPAYAGVEPGEHVFVVRLRQSLHVNTLSGQFGNSLADGFQLADSLLAKQHWHEGADQRHDCQGAEEYCRRAGVRLQQERRSQAATTRPHDSPKY